MIDEVYTFTDGTKVATEVKPAARAKAQNLGEQLSFVAAAMRPEFAETLVLITEENYDQWEALNARRLLAYRREDDPEAASIIAGLAAELELPVTIRDLIARAAIGGRAWPEVFKAIYAGVLPDASSGTAATPPSMRGVPGRRLPQPHRGPAGGAGPDLPFIGRSRCCSCSPLCCR